MFYLIEIDLSIELLFLLNISGAASKKNEALAVHLKTQNRSRQLSYLPFSRLFQMSCQGTYWCHTLIEQKQSTRKRKLLKKL